MSHGISQCAETRNPSLVNLFWMFLKIGSTAFGGFMALISVVQNHVVDRKKLLSHEDFLNGISLASILPGPVAVNLVAYSGYRIRGIAGAAVCTVAVILPSFVLMLVLTYLYLKSSELPLVSQLLQGFLPAVTAIIIAAVLNLGRKSVNGMVEVSIAFTAMVILIMIGGFFTTLMIIAGSGLVGLALYGAEAQQPVESRAQKSIDYAITGKSRPGELLPFAVAALTVILVPLISSSSYIGAKLFSSFAAMSLLLFGGGFVFIPLMQESIVDVYQWVSHREFVDAIAMGQITPGPILISATFIGYKVAGFVGAIIATIGIFLPPAMLMLVCTHYMDSLMASSKVKAVMKGIHSGVLGMIAAAAYIVATSTQIDINFIAIFSLSLVLLVIYRVDVIWVIPLSALLGYVLF